MVRNFVSLLFAGLLILPITLSQGAERDLVPDPETAIAVATAILKTYMGPKNFNAVAARAPLKAELEGVTWTVSFYERDIGKEVRRTDGKSVVVVAGGGGNPTIQLDKRDARVIGVFYTR